MAAYPRKVMLELSKAFMIDYQAEIARGKVDKVNAYAWSFRR
jgi:hypothetical protein